MPGADESLELVVRVARVKIAVMGYGIMARMFRDMVLPCEFQDRVSIRVYDLFLDEALETAKRLEREKAVDVFISGGGNASYIRPHLKTPVISIDVTTADLASAIKRAAACGDVIAVASFMDPVPGLDDLVSILKPKIVPIVYERDEDLREKMLALKEQGCRAVVGASLTCEIAELLGMTGVLVYSEERLALAVRHAVEVAESRRREIERAESFQNVINFTYSGILVTDAEGTVTVFNPAAERILNVPAGKVIGQRAEDVIGDCRVAEVLQSGEARFNQIQEVSGVRIVANTIPITTGQGVVGVVATFQDAASIKKASDKIRTSQYPKGFVARARLSDIAYRSEAMDELVRRAARYARSDLPILITGESGVGKEIFAQGIHNESPRRHGPFVAINCAALSESLLESELFGYEEGSFTGAKKGGKEGLCEVARHGTLFLDEIGEIPPGFQAHLLRVIQEKEILRVGGTRVIPVDIRIIASTHRDLWSLVEQQRFRDDLYYRLNVLSLRIPALRERPEDVPVLVKSLLAKRPAADRNLLTESRVEAICRHLLRYHWPGNIRELENFIERLVINLEGKAPSPETLAAVCEDLLRSLQEEKGIMPTPAAADRGRDRDGLSERVMRTRAEMVREALTRFSGNRTLAARSLGISRTTLWRVLKEDSEAVGSTSARRL